MSKKPKKGYFNDREVIVAYITNEGDYMLVYFKDDKNKSKFKINTEELKENGKI